MSGAETDERSILDYLNEDCWCAVLDYVPLEDILRTEPASHRWQEAMLRYLRGVRIDIKTPPRFWRKIRHYHIYKPKWCKVNKNVKKNKFYRLTLTSTHRLSFEYWTSKLGPSVATAYCDSTDSMKIYENCPNLETLTLIDLPEDLPLNTQNENFKWLKRLAFKKCYLVSDRSVSKFMKYNTIEELEIHGNTKLTGKFLINKNLMNFKSLSMKLCFALDFSHLIAASGYLSELRKFELIDCAHTVYEDIHLMLDKLPKLEHVKMHGAERDSRNFFEALCRLKHLKSLSMDFNATDADLEAVTRCCAELNSLCLRFCYEVSHRGLAVACAHAGSRLVALGITFPISSGSRTLTDDHIVACVRACPNLKFLNVDGNHGLTRDFYRRVAAVRREMRAPRPLNLGRGVFTHYGSKFQDEYEELIIC